MKFYRNERIEEIAEQRLREFEGKLGRPFSIPVDIQHKVRPTRLHQKGYRACLRRR
jgi:hypothetical protein